MGYYIFHENGSESDGWCFKYFLFWIFCLARNLCLNFLMPLLTNEISKSLNYSCKLKTLIRLFKRARQHKIKRVSRHTLIESRVFWKATQNTQDRDTVSNLSKRGNHLKGLADAINKGLIRFNYIAYFSRPTLAYEVSSSRTSGAQYPTNGTICSDQPILLI